MSFSFRTNGNYIDFVHTDNTSLAVESVLKSLHNTSRCVSWSLPEDETRITFTVDEVQYGNVLITDIDFDGTAMNSQDDFETGITAMFTGLEGGGAVLSATVELTDAQIKALPTTPIEIIAAQGSDKMIFAVFATLQLKNYVADYTNIDATASLQLVSTGTSAGTLVNVAQNLGTSLGNILAAGDNTLNWLQLYQGIVSNTIVPATGSIPSDFNNQNLAIKINNQGDGNLTDGDSSTTLKVTVYYVVVDL